MIYEDMLKNNYERVMIFEDDAVPDPSALHNIPGILAELPADWELLMWGWDKNGKAPAGARDSTSAFRTAEGCSI